MKITSKEYITLDGFTPKKVIELYNNGKHFYTYKTADTTQSLIAIKEHQRHERRSAKPNAKLYIADENGNKYRYLHLLTFDSIAEEYKQLKELKAYLEKHNANTIQVTTENGIEREYKHTYTIKHIKTACA